MTTLKRGDRVELPATQGEVTHQWASGAVELRFDGTRAPSLIAAEVAKSLVRVKPPFQPREGGIYKFGCGEILWRDGLSWRYFDTHILSGCATAELIALHGEPVELKLVPVTE